MAINHNFLYKPARSVGAALERESSTRYKGLTAQNRQKWKSGFLTSPCYEIYREEAVVLKKNIYT